MKQGQAGPFFVVLSGPSGVGKDALLARLKESGLPLTHITTVTTRRPRPGERNGVSYHFVSPEAFQKMRAGNELLEWAEVYGNCYGTPRRPVEEALGAGRDVIVKVDVQGAISIKRALPQAVLIFLMAASRDELINRLAQRNTESPTERARRAETVEKELGQLDSFDYLVINAAGSLDRAAAQVQAIITAEKCRRPG